MYCGVVLGALFSLAIILLRKRELSWLLCFNHVVAVCSESFLHDTVSCSAACDSGIFWSYKGSTEIQKHNSMIFP